MAITAIIIAAFCHALERRCGIESVRRPQGGRIFLWKREAARREQAQRAIRN